MGAPKKLTQEIQNLIFAYIRDKGKLTGCTHELPIKLGFRTVTLALDSKSQYYFPAFHEGVQQAFRDYKTLHRHPAQDPKIQADAYQQFSDGIRSGRSNQVFYEYDDNKKVVRKTYKNFGLQKWEWDVLHPRAEWSQESILFVVSNQIDSVLSSGMGESEQMKFLKWLQIWKNEAIEELQKRGLQTKLIEENGEPTKSQY